MSDVAFDYAKNTAGLDFLVVTDHTNLYDQLLDWDSSTDLDREIKH